MNRILPHSLWLGHLGDRDNVRQLFDAGVRAVVDLAAEEPPAQPPRDLIYLRIPLLDGTGNADGTLLLAAGTVATLVRMHLPTLVCCNMGMSRAPAALAALGPESPEECLQRVVAHHPSDVSPSLWGQVALLA